MNEFTFRELVARAAFDYVGPIFPTWWAENRDLLVFPDLHDITAELRRGGSYFTTLKLSYEGEFFDLPNEPLISLSRTKTIIETPTVGTHSEGPVYEFITSNNWEIKVVGVAMDLNNPENYPSEQVETLNKLYEINDSVEVVNNVFLGLFGIERMLLRRQDIESMPGIQGAQKYEFEAVAVRGFFADLLSNES